MSRKTTIAIDIDDVLADNAGRFVEFSNGRWGTALTRNDYIGDWSSLWGVDFGETRVRADEYVRSGVFLDYHPIVGSKDAIRRLANEFEVKILTSRSLSTRDDTIEWLNREFNGLIGETNIHFAGIWDGAIDDSVVNRTKGAMLKSLGADYIIDDQLKHCLGAASVGDNAILFGNYAWNQVATLPNGVIRLDDWDEVVRYFYEK